MLVTILVAVAGACVPQASPDQRSSVDGEAETGPRCRASSAAAVALLDQADGCGVAVELDGDALVLRELDAAAEPSSTLARGRPPEACGPELSLCTIEGQLDAELGPLVLLGLRGPESEVPTQLYLGWVEQGRLAFVETWYGPPSVADHTRIGPAWALAPFACEGELVLAPAPRLPEAEVEGPHEVLDQLRGPWTIPTEGGAPLGPTAARDSVSGCRPALAALP